MNEELFVKRIVILTLLLFGLAACAPQPVETEATAVAPQPTLENDTALPGVQSLSQPRDTEADAAAYPAPTDPTPLPEGYPAPEPLATSTAYPVENSNPIWVLYPVGEQCGAADSGTYADLTEAIAGLTAVGVPVLDSEVTEIAVCAACGCPTSAHYRAQIAVSDLATAVQIGWLDENTAYLDE